MPRFLLNFTLLLCAVGVHTLSAQKRDGNRWISFAFENDVLLQSDQDFTHGTSLAYCDQLWSKTFIRKLFFHSASEYNMAGLQLVSNLYTPAAITTSTIDNDDRPFTATLELGLNFISFYKKTRLSSAITIGVIGDCAMGKQVQSFVHKLPGNQQPIGWENQMACSPLVTYAIKADYSLISKKTIELFASGAGRIGMPQTSADAGLMCRVGNFYSYLQSTGVENKKYRETKQFKQWQLYVQASGSIRVVAYDAVLEGGLFNKTKSPYLIDPNRITHLYTIGEAGLYASFKNLSCSLKASVMGKTFDTGRIDKWASFVVQFAF